MTVDKCEKQQTLCSSFNPYLWTDWTRMHRHICHNIVAILTQTVTKSEEIKMPEYKMTTDLPYIK